LACETPCPIDLLQGFVVSRSRLRSWAAVEALDGRGVPRLLLLLLPLLLLLLLLPASRSTSARCRPSGPD
jgi:hypothetical protein